MNKRCVKCGAEWGQPAFVVLGLQEILRYRCACGHCWTTPCADSTPAAAGEQDIAADLKESDSIIVTLQEQLTAALEDNERLLARAEAAESDAANLRAMYEGDLTNDELRMVRREHQLMQGNDLHDAVVYDRAIRLIRSGRGG